MSAQLPKKQFLLLRQNMILPNLTTLCSDLPYLLEPPDRLLRVEPPTTVEADLAPHLQDRGVSAASQGRLHLLALFAAMEL